jgi:hypothetical protein
MQVPPPSGEPAPTDTEWSVGKLALAAVLALVVTAALTFAVLKLRGL